MTSAAQTGGMAASDTGTSAWAVGLEVFAGVTLAVVGFFQGASGLVGLLNDPFYVVGERWAFTFNTTAWGWIHLALGAILLASGIGIFTGNVLARGIGVIAAAVSAVAMFLWLPYYPVWAVLVIALDVAIIWALTMHGRDIAHR
jgi:hypothetical protein